MTARPPRPELPEDSGGDMRPHLPTDPAALRQEAEVRVKQRHATSPPAAKAGLKRIQHELEVHRVEFEPEHGS